MGTGQTLVTPCAEKLAVAVPLRAKTAVTVKWIAGRLQMGAPGYLNHLLYRERNEQGECN